MTEMHFDRCSAYQGEIYDAGVALQKKMFYLPGVIKEMGVPI